MSERIAPDGKPAVKVAPFDAGRQIGVQLYCNLVGKRWAARIEPEDAEALIEALRDGLKEAAQKRAFWAQECIET